MSINISTGGTGGLQDPTIVNVGDEITSAQLAALQNAQGASATNPFLTRTNTFNTADAAVRITQDGTGNAFEVYDVSEDTTPFQINASGQVAVTGPIFGGASLSVTGPASFVGNNTFTGSTTCSVTSSSGTPLNVSSTSTSNSSVALFVDYRGTGDAVRITNTGTGNSFVVEDETNPDSTPFVINNIGSVGIGTTSPTARLQVSGSTVVSSGSTISPIFQVTQSNTASVASFTNTATATADAVRITNLGTGNSFIVEDDTNPDNTPFAINAAGDVAIGSSSFNGKLRVTGRSYFENTSGAGGNAVLWARSSASTTVPVGQFSSDSVHTGPTLVVSNQGTGNSFVVEDSASDTTTFVIDNAGNVTLGGSLTLESAAYNANTALVIDNTNYPHELTFKVGSTTYRVPARAI